MKLDVAHGARPEVVVDDVDAAGLAVQGAAAEVEVDVIAPVHVASLELVIAADAGIATGAVCDEVVVLGGVDAAERGRKAVVVVVQAFGLPRNFQKGPFDLCHACEAGSSSGGSSERGTVRCQ